MDGGGRFAEPLTRLPASRSAVSGSAHSAGKLLAAIRGGARLFLAARRQLRVIPRWINGKAERIAALQVPRHAGVVASTLIISSSIVWGTVRGGHAPAVIGWVKDARDLAANAVGFSISTVRLAGNSHLSPEEVLAIAGVTGRTSLLFLDVADARNRLKANPWIADATVQKLYPNRLEISVVERQAFALWQKSGRVGVIAADGTLLETYITPRFAQLPVVVGSGAEKRAKEFLSLLDSYPHIRDEVTASVLVGERRWNLRLRAGIDVRLPESGVAQALDRLSTLDREKGLISRELRAIDLRLPDRVTVQLSDEAAQAREEALKPKKAKPKGGNA
jgi:cell division protein FtsQ